MKTIDYALEIEKHGSKSAAARALGISPRTLNRRLEGASNSRLNVSMAQSASTGPRVLVWDVERSTFEHTARYYELKQRNLYLKPDKITQEWVLLGAAWGWLDDNAISVVSVHPEDPMNDYGVVKHLHSALERADVLLGHNSDAFDLKTFNTRALFHGFRPIAPKKKIDTLKIARKYFKFTSNKLSYIADYLGVDAKDASPDWNAIIEGCPDEIRYMRKYNKQDVKVTKEVYNKLSAWDETLDLNSFRGGVRHIVCKSCGSSSVAARGYDRRGKTLKRRYSCNSCGRWSQYTMAELKRMGIT